jgi:hypothetical protein
MTPISGEEHLLPVLITTVLVMQSGLLLSEIANVAYSVQNWLSKYTRVEKADPAAFKRIFERIFDALFAPVGSTVAKKCGSPGVRQISYQLAVGGVVLVTAVVVQLVMAGAVTGAAVTAHQAFGITLNPVPVFRQLIALVVISSFAVMHHAEGRAKRVTNP